MQEAEAESFAARPHNTTTITAKTSSVVQLPFAVP